VRIVAQTVGQLMTKIVVQLPAETNLIDAARAMRDGHIGSVLVTEQGTLTGVVTDRDIVVRGIARGKDATTTTLSEVASGDVVSIDEEAPAAEAVDLMRDRAVRRLAVKDRSGSLVGILSLGDLAVARDPRSALGEISGAPHND
jgi:CBS domain-containing protein